MNLPGFVMCAFSPLPLGSPIPDSVHAVSCSLPTMRDIRGYEEKNPEITRCLTTGYPRFLVHPFARELAGHFESSQPSLAGQTLWLANSERAAHALVAHLGVASEAKSFRDAGVAGAAHPANVATGAEAKKFLQHVGGFISSRAAEDELVRRGLRQKIASEETFAGDARGEVIGELRRAIPEAGPDDLFLSNCGMSAFYAAFQAISAEQAPRGRTIWVQLGWLYLDTIAILRKFTPTPSDYVYLRDVFDLGALEKICRQHGHRIAGVVAELPTNPLIQTPDVPRLSGLCRAHGIRLVLDPSVASVYNLRVLEFSDLTVGSLTKYTASAGDLTAGLVAVNPAGPAAAELRSQVASVVEPLYARDLARLAREIRDTTAVLESIHQSTPQIVDFLSRHRSIREVYWALQPRSRDNYLRIARHPEATGGMITFTLQIPLEQFYDRLTLPKGPSFGMKNTLICPFMYLAHYDLVTSPAGMAELAASHLEPDLLRLCVGTEPVAEIIGALEEALE